MKRADTPTARPPAEERCTCGRLLVMGLPCTHHVEAAVPDVIGQAVALTRSLRAEGRTDDAQLVGGLIGALRYQRAVAEELRPLVSAVKFRQAGDRALRSSR